MGFVAKLERQVDDEERPSIKRVEAIRRQLPRKDWLLIDLYLQEGGNNSAVARRLGPHRAAVSDDYYRLFQWIAVSA